MSTAVTIDAPTPPVLILDKEGFYGYLIAQKLREFTNVVFVSSKDIPPEKKLLSLPYGRVLTNIPSEAYSHIFFIPKDINDIEDHLDLLVKKSKEDNSLFVIILLKSQVTKAIVNALKTYKEKLIVIVLGDIFGKNTTGEVQAFLTVLNRKKSIKLPNMGLYIYYPVSIEDAFAEIIKLSFGSVKNGWYLVYTNFPVTQLGIVRAIQKVDPEITIDFLHEKQEEQENLVLEGEYVLKESYDAFTKIQNSYKELGHGSKIISFRETPVLKKNEQTPDFWQKTNIKNKKSARSWIFPCFIFLLIFLFFFITAFSFYILLGLRQVSIAKKQIESNNLSKAVVSLRQGLDILNTSSSLVGYILPASVSNWLDNSLSVLKSISYLTEGVDSLQKDPQNVFKGIGLLQRGFLEINQAGDIGFAPEIINNNIDALKKVSAYFINNEDIFSDALGFSGKKTYLVLFQNNMELRPGGGFIGSYGILKINKGKVERLEISDVYDADGQLSGHVEPPFPIRRYLGKVHLYLRDSNFDVDFPKDAFSSAFLLKLETGEKVDGVIAVDLSFARELIRALGKIYVPQYNATVTADNFFLLAEKNAENNFFPGSTQKKDFLRSVFGILQQQILTKGILNTSSIVVAIVNGIKNKHILFVSGNPGSQDLLTANNMSGSIWDGRSVLDNTFLDSAGINEGNIGVNKENAYLTRSVRQSIKIDQSGSVSATLTVNFKNNNNGTWPGGEYYAYVQVFLPTFTNIQSIVLDNVVQRTIPAITDFLIYEKDGFVSPGGLEVNTFLNNNKAVSGFLIRVPIKTEKRLDINYVFNKNIDMFNSLLSYDLLYQKQPGTDDYPYEAEISVPDDYAFYKGDGFLGTGSQAFFIGNISTDKRLKVTFRRK